MNPIHPWADDGLYRHVQVDQPNDWLALKMIIEREIPSIPCAGRWSIRDYQDLPCMPLH